MPASRGRHGQGPLAPFVRGPALGTPAGSLPGHGPGLRLCLPAAAVGRAGAAPPGIASARLRTGLFPGV